MRLLDKAMKAVFCKPVLSIEGTGKKIKRLMKQKCVTPQRVAAMLGFPYVQTMYNWFSGRNLPTLDNLVALAYILGVKVDDLLATNFVTIEYEEKEEFE